MARTFTFWELEDKVERLANAFGSFGAYTTQEQKDAAWPALEQRAKALEAYGLRVELLPILKEPFGEPS